MTKIFVSKFGVYFLLACFLVSVAVFILPQLRRSAQIKLGSAEGISITADRQDSLGTFTDTHFTLKSDSDLSTAEIKNNLVFFPEIDYDVRSVSARQFTIIPKTNLNNNSLYKIQVKTNQKVFSWAFQTKNDFRVVQTLPRDKATYVPLNSGIEVSFSHDNWEDLEDHFSITPKVSGRFERHNRTLSFVPQSLAPSTLYTVKVTKGVKLKGTQEVLKDDFVFQFETKSENDNYTQQINFVKRYYEFSTQEVPVFDFYSGSETDTKINVSLYKYPTDAQFQTDFKTKLAYPAWATNSQQNQRLSTEKLSSVLNFETSFQKQTYLYYFLFPDKVSAGHYLVEVTKGSQRIQTLFQVTDVSAYLTQAGNKTLVWVNSVNSGQAIPQAKVSYNGRDVFTDDQGVAYFDTMPEDLLQDRGTIIISHALGNLIIPVTSARYYFDKKYQNDQRQRDKYWTYLYLDRPVYLPNDNLKFWGLLRNRDQLNQKQNFTIQISRSDYYSWSFTPITLYESKGETSDLGTFISEISLKNYSPGWYSLDIKVGDNTIISSGFSVETYVKPAYQITLNSSSKAVIAGESVRIDGQVSFFESTPVQNLSLKVINYPEETTTKSDSLGKFSITKTPSLYPNNNYSPQFNQYTFTPQNPEEGQVSATTSIAVFDSSLVFMYPKTEIRNGVGIINLDLRKVETAKYQNNQDYQNIFGPAQNRNIKGIVYEISWNKREVGNYYDFISKKISPHYEYDQVKNQIAEVNLMTGQDGKTTQSLSLDRGKSYEVQYTATDDQGRSTYQTAYIYSSVEQSTNFDYLYLKTDKTGDKPTSYQVGEQVNLSFSNNKNDFSTNSQDRFLFILSQRGIRSFHHSTDGKLSFKFPEDFSPNVFVEAVRFNGKTYQATGGLNLYFDTTTKKLLLDISLDKNQYEPADTVKISVTTKDVNGNPVASEVNLNLVDEAYYSLYPEYIDPLSNIYKMVSADQVASYLSHQYPLDKGGAEGGGGGGGGSLFRDTAYFGSLRTNSFGQGSIDVKLPDNLTSWRISAQGITSSLQAGFQTKPLIVKLPFFVSAIMNTEYLSADKPIVFVRSSGDILQIGDVVSLQVDSDTLNLHKTLSGLAFESVPVDLGALTPGSHKITFLATSNKGSYKLERSFDVVNSRLSISKTNYQNLSENIKLTGADKSFTTVIFSDQSRGKYYPQLSVLSYTWGDRLDQKLARTLSQELIKKYFDSTQTVESFEAKHYQTPNGGLGIYPYADSDLAISAFISALSSDDFDQNALKNYFYGQLSIAKDINTAAKALFGISVQDEPVLIQINSLLDDPKIDPESQIYLGLALAQIGDTERATSLFKQLLAKYQKFQDNQSFIDMGGNKDKVLLHTALMADLASLVDDPASQSLLWYLDTNSTKDVLLNSEKLYAIKNILDRSQPENVSFNYQLNNKKQKVALDKGQTQKIILSPEDLKNISFSDINGNVGVITTFLSPLSSAEGQSGSVSITRSYYSAGKQTNQLASSDLVKVALKYNHTEIGQDGCYQVTDILPSGLKPVTAPYSLGIGNTDVNYPYEINGQRISFCVYKNSKQNPLIYYARVVNPGEFRAENVLIQSLISPSVYNLSDSAQVTIK